MHKTVSLDPVKRIRTTPTGCDCVGVCVRVEADHFRGLQGVRLYKLAGAGSQGANDLDPASRLVMSWPDKSFVVSPPSGSVISARASARSIRHRLIICRKDGANLDGQTGLACQLTPARRMTTKTRQRLTALLQRASPPAGASLVSRELRPASDKLAVTADAVLFSQQVESTALTFAGQNHGTRSTNI
jgi:hypothetical protein